MYNNYSRSEIYKLEPFHNLTLSFPLIAHQISLPRIVFSSRLVYNLTFSVNTDR